MVRYPRQRSAFTDSVIKIHGQAQIDRLIIALDLEAHRLCDGNVISRQIRRIDEDLRPRSVFKLGIFSFIRLDLPFVCSSSSRLRLDIVNKSDYDSKPDSQTAEETLQAKAAHSAQPADTIKSVSATA